MEKLEAAKLATQLTIALLENKNGHLAQIIRAAKKPVGDGTPDTVIAFDYLLDHLQSRFNEQ